MSPDEAHSVVSRELRQELDEAAKKKLSKTLTFSVTISEGGIRSVKVSAERTLK